DGRRATHRAEGEGRVREARGARGDARAANLRLRTAVELRPWTLPNFLTFARLAALPFLILAILDGRHWAALVIFLAAGVTDIGDGYLARRFHMGSPLGAWLDPIADKLFLVSSFVVFALPGTPTTVRIPMWLLVLTIFRDVFILVIGLVLFLALGMRSFPP